MRNLIDTIKSLYRIGFNRTPWGIAYILTAWKLYRTSELFKLRAESFGTNGAADFLTDREFKYFMWKAKREYAFDLKLTFAPFTVIEELGKEDNFLKIRVGFAR